MNQAEVIALSDKDLKKSWEAIKTAYRVGLPQILDNLQGLILFADFVNVSSEMDKRNLPKFEKWVQKTNS